MLWETLSDDLVFVNLEADDCFQVFDRLGGKLTELGYGKSSYVQALKDREKSYPTGIQVDQIGVAIPHADLEHINNTAVAIATLKEPVTFYHMGTEPSEGVEVKVKFVIMLAVAGGNHIDFLQKAVMLIQDYPLLNRLVEADSSETIIKLIKEKEEELNENN